MHHPSHRPTAVSQPLTDGSWLPTDGSQGRTAFATIGHCVNMSSLPSALWGTLYGTWFVRHGHLPHPRCRRTPAVHRTAAERIGGADRFQYKEGKPERRKRTSSTSSSIGEQRAEEWPPVPLVGSGPLLLPKSDSDASLHPKAMPLQCPLPTPTSSIGSVLVRCTGKLSFQAPRMGIL